MIRLLAIWSVFLATAVLAVVLREEKLVRHGKVPLGRLRRLWFRNERRRAPRVVGDRDAPDAARRQRVGAIEREATGHERADERQERHRARRPGARRTSSLAIREGFSALANGTAFARLRSRARGPRGSPVGCRAPRRS